MFAPSKVFIAYVCLPVPSAPRNLNVSVYGTGALRVEWSAPVEINANPLSVQYMIRANGMLVNTVGDRQVKLTELDPGTQYTIEVCGSVS